ncbi:MAG: DUF1289 domain-containing protein [Pseudomonadota bacterium]
MTEQPPPPVWQRAEIASPCVNICMIHPETKLCLGCARTGDEIARWSTMSAEERRAIMDDLPQRDPGPKARSGGRRSRMKRRSI